MLKKRLNKIVDNISVWLTGHAGDLAVFYVVAVFIGIVSGMAAALLKKGIDLVTRGIFGPFNLHAGNLMILFLPVIGILLVTLITRYYIKARMDHATERVAQDLADNQVSMNPKLIWGSVISCSITLGMGGSAGAESPIAYTGAAIGSNLGRAFKMSQQTIATLVGCGGAAGIAGIYMAPIGGVMFALEMLKMKQDLSATLALTLSSLASALTCYILLGCHTDVSFVPDMRFDLHLIPYVLLFGVICGIYSLYYSRLLELSRNMFNRIDNIWYKALSGGLVLAVCLFLFPSLYGEGYNIIGKLMDNDSLSVIAYGPFYHFGSKFYVLLLLMVALLLIKPLATSATNDSGGVGGDFTPTFFCGGVAGYMFAALANHLFALNLPVALFAFFGMAAIMSGSKKAPLMAIFIAAEMTGMYGFILPLTLAALSSFLLVVIVDNRKSVAAFFRPVEKSA